MPPEKKNAPIARLRALDDRLCDACVRFLHAPAAKRLRPALLVLCAAAGFAASSLLGGSGVIESFVLGAVFALWSAALFYRRHDRAFDLLLLGIALFALFGARMRCLSVVSPDCQDYLLPWVEAMRGMTFGEVMRGRVGDYTVLYQYFVFLLSRLSLDPVAMYKALSIGFEALLAMSCARLACAARGEADDSPVYPLVFLLILALPTVLLNSAIWAQCDAVYAALALYGVHLCHEGKGTVGCSLLTLSLSLKLQAVFILPVCALLFFWRKLSLRHVLTALLTLLLVAVPALLCGKGIKGVLGVYLYQMGEYDQLVLGAPTIHQLTDGSPLIPADAASAAGILLAFGAMALVLALGARSRRSTLSITVDICFALCLVIPFLLPHMHERYFFLADVLSVVYAAVHPRRVWAPAVVLLGSLNGYLAYLFSAQLIGWTVPTLAMLALCAAVLALLARDVHAQSVSVGK